MATKALLVGINKYEDAPLKGCVNDVQAMAEYLNTTCGFNSATIRLLTDGRATTEAILERLNWLTTGLEPGDRIYFHFSGHGTQVPTRSKKSGEVDGLDEVICPVDFDFEKHLIRDDQLIDFFSRVPEGVQAIWVSDSCHSGDLSRSGFSLIGPKQTPRYMPMPEDIAWRHRAVVENGILPRSQKKTSHTPVPNVALITGCKSNQTSADSSFKGKPFGALTYHLLNQLQQTPGHSLSEVVDGVRKQLKKARFTQVPQLEGSPAQTELSFFG